MNKLIISLALLLSNVAIVTAQTGVNTRNTNDASILEVNSASKGVLLPRLNITSLTNKAPIIAATMPDGLLAYNSGATNGQTLYYWDVLANANAGAWMPQLYFKETPKVATIGLINDLALLDNIGRGGGAQISQATNNFKIISSGYMPGLKINNNNNGFVVVGPGTYTLEISYLFNAPAANPIVNATVISNGYYNMGYYSDLWLRSFDPNATIYGTSYLTTRVEGAILSKVNVDHRMRFLHTFAVTGAGLVFELRMVLGRRDGTTFYDLVNILSSGTIIKLTKLN